MRNCLLLVSIAIGTTIPFRPAAGQSAGSTSDSSQQLRSAHWEDRQRHKRTRSSRPTAGRSERVASSSAYAFTWRV